MKKTFLALAVTLGATTLNAFVQPTVSKSSELAEKIVMALQHESANEFAVLLPTIDELDMLIDDHREFYDVNVEAAKADLALYYTTSTLPQLHRNFENLIVSGKNKGIEWSKISLESVEFRNTENEIIITINYNSKQYMVRLEKVLRIREQWRATQFITLV